MNILKKLFTYYILRRPIPGLYDETDSRNFGAKYIAGAVTKNDLVDGDFQTCRVDLIHQKFSDFCVGCGKAYDKQASEGMKMSWAGAFALGCKAQGFISDYGISILQVMKGAVKFGVPEIDKWPYTGNRAHDADWTQMPKDVLDNAYLHRDASFFEIEPQIGFDQFDLFRGYLNKFKDRKVVIQTGVDNHNVTLIGQVEHNGELCLFGPDSYGTHTCAYRIGKCVNGYRYFPRNEANQLFRGYMSFDMPRSLAELLVKYTGKAIKLEDNNDCYLVKDGKKQLLRNEAIAWAHNTLLFGENYVFVLTPEEFNQIPTTIPVKFEDGANHEIIQRILEKLGKLDLINEK